MPANHCPDCDAAWPRHHTKCPACNRALIFKTALAAMSKDEYDDRMRFIRALKGNVAPLPDGVQEYVDQEWARLEDLAARTPLTVADLIDAAPRWAA